MNKALQTSKHAGASLFCVAQSPGVSHKPLSFAAYKYEPLQDGRYCIWCPPLYCNSLADMCTAKRGSARVTKSLKLNKNLPIEEEIYENISSH